MAINDFYIFLTGTQAGGARGNPADDLKYAGTAKTDGEKGQMDEFKDIKGRAGFDLLTWCWYGSIKSSASVSAARSSLVSARGYIPGASRLIIYGYSAGGKNALELCRELDNFNADQSSTFALAVDLLVTVDAAAWDESDKIDRKLAKCVKRNVNYWQPNGGVSGSHGAVNTGDPASQKTDEQWQFDVDHGKLNDFVRAGAKQKIQQVISAPSTELSLAGQWDVVIGSWRGLMEFGEDGTASWEETDPQRKQADPKVHFGKWWQDDGVFKWEYRDDKANIGWERTFQARRALGRTVKGQALDKATGAQRGLYEMTKR